MLELRWLQNIDHPQEPVLQFRNSEGGWPGEWQDVPVVCEARVNGEVKACRLVFDGRIMRLVPLDET